MGKKKTKNTKQKQSGKSIEKEKTMRYRFDRQLNRYNNMVLGLRDTAVIIVPTSISFR